MLIHDHLKKQLKVEIEISHIEELYNYQNGIRGILRKIEIASCDEELKENLKAVYELLSHLQAEPSLINHTSSFLNKSSRNNA